MFQENAALLTGREVRDCPACEDAGRFERQLLSGPGADVAYCDTGHNYAVASTTLYPDGTRKFVLTSRVDRA